MKRRWHSLLFVTMILMGGCDMEAEKPKQWPKTVAFQDEFTRKFLVSTEEVKDGYYLFRSQTGGFTMLFPKEAKMNRGFYEKHRDHYEVSTLAGIREKENIIYDIDVTYENEEITEKVDLNLALLGSYTGYDEDGEYTKIKTDRVTIYFAKNAQDISVDQKKNIVYNFFAYIKSNQSHRAVRFIYGVTCKDAHKKCHIDVAKEEERAKMLVKSVKFQD